MTSHAVPVSTDLRLLRAAVFTVVCVLLSTAGHTLAAGSQVPLWTLGAGSLWVLLMALPLAGRRRSLPGITLGLAAGQVGLHLLFTRGQHGSRGHRGPDRPGHRGHASDAAFDGSIPRTDAVNALADPLGQLLEAGHGTVLTCGLPMLLGHLLAALAAGWLLRRGDLALYQLTQWSTDAVAQMTVAAAWLRALGTAVRAGVGQDAGRLPTSPRCPPASDRPRPASTAVGLQHAVIRRGPPGAADLSLAV